MKTDLLVDLIHTISTHYTAYRENYFFPVLLKFNLKKHAYK